MSWRTVSIGEIATMKYGKLPPKETCGDDGFPIFTGYRISGFSKEYLYEDSEVIVVARGVGGTGDVKMSPAKSWITNLSIVLSVDPLQIHKRFLFYRLGQEPLKEKLNTGAAQAQITIENLQPYRFTIPTFDIQRRISDTLHSYDNLIENNRRRMTLLEDSARLLYNEWFVRLRFPGYEHTSIVDGVPEGWELKTLGEVSKINQINLSGTFDGEIEYIDIASVTPNSINETTRYHFRDAPGRARRVVRHGDIIWSCVRPNRRSHAVIWQPPENLIASTGFAVITPTSLPTSFLYQSVTADLFVGYLENHAKGAAYPAVVSGDFQRAEVLVPSSQLVTAFNAFAEPLLSQTNNLHLQNQKLRAARDLLLPRLMSGEINV